MTNSLEKPVSVGIIGYGFIGQEIARRIAEFPHLFSLCFVHCRDRNKAANIKDALFLADLDDLDRFNPDIIIEAAHPAITEKYGPAFLKNCDYLPLSTGALIEDDLVRLLKSTASKHGNTLYLAAGALVGGSELDKKLAGWERVQVTFKKHPDNIDFSDVHIKPEKIKAETEIFNGPVRDIAKLFPRNVNTMVTTALLSTGVDQCTGILIADPELDCAVAIVEAWGKDGGYIRTEKRQPAIGVSGSEMADSAWYSLMRATGKSREATQFV